MGFDISYHPINEDEIKRWYFEVLDNQSVIEQLATEYSIEEFYVNKYKDTINVALNTDVSENFDVTHGYYIAVVQGFFRKYFYTRGSAFSFLIENDNSFADYTTGWQAIVPPMYENPRVERIITNYSSGVYISSDKVKMLLSDFENKEKIRQKLIDFYSHGRIDIFISALKFAASNNLGLLEATEVVEPNPLDLNKSSCYSNLFNCDIEGPLLYREAALEQIREIEKDNNLPEGEISGKASYERTNIEGTNQQDSAEKKSFWKKLFGK